MILVEHPGSGKCFPLPVNLALYGTLLPNLSIVQAHIRTNVAKCRLAYAAGVLPICAILYDSSISARRRRNSIDGHAKQSASVSLDTYHPECLQVRQRRLHGHAVQANTLIAQSDCLLTEVHLCVPCLLLPFYVTNSNVAALL